MAPSFRELIDFLLAEIALCGDQGASPADILKFTAAFYTKAAQHASDRTNTVDRRFQEKVWSWLTRNPEVSVGKHKEGNHLSLANIEALSRHPSDDAESAETPGAFRVFVSKERTWLAVTGHEPDETKVFSSEFALLSIIASRGSNGIPQTELVRLSGQDKRSVPKRTDSLRQKGYIEKRAIQIKSARTSLCTLRKFLHPENLLSEPSTQDVQAEGQLIDFKKFTEDLFRILREHKIISRVDLKTSLGFADRWRWRILSRSLRKFERIGVLKRVRAPSQYADTLKKYHPCVKLIREPSEKDYAKFHEFSLGVLMDEEPEDNAELDDDVEPNDGERGSASLENGLLDQEQDVEDVGRPIPTWTPDRSIHNQIFEVIHKSGTDGIVNQGIIRSHFGSFFRRPLENVLSRLVECWQLSQPLHLRHLAIVRDTAINRTVTHFVHYSAVNFGKRVEAGETTWEAVEFNPKNSKSAHVRVQPADAVPNIDDNGLPIHVLSKELLRDGNASLFECMAVFKPQGYNVTSSDPFAAKLENGTYRLDYGIKKSLSAVQLQGARGDNKKIIKTEDQDLGSPEKGTATPVVKRLKKPKTKQWDLGLSEKERLEALGLDETWTEYSVLTMERKTPGVYVTPRGRRRATGRGRPRTSRVAVFKSPKLASIPWFLEGADVSVQPNREVSTTPPAEPSGTNDERGIKRTLHHSPSRGSDSEARVATKQRRLDAIGSESMNIETPGTHITESDYTGRDSDLLVPDAGLGTPTRTQKRKRPTTPEREEGLEVASEGSISTPASQPAPKHVKTPFKKPRRQSRRQPQEDDRNLPPADQPAKETLPAEASTSADPSNAPMATPIVPKSNEERPTPLASVGPGTSPASVQPNSTGKARLVGGSVGFLRRKIVMGILDQTGGAFPYTGGAIWYPFTTAWAKLKHKEKPDLRTIRTTVKHMIDAGILRQLVFSGKDHKGVMVTKKIIARSDMDPDDPVIQGMQRDMLASDEKQYFPQGVEFDKDLTKSGRSKLAVVPSIPIESSIKVQLQQKPAFVVAQEKKRGLVIQRRLLQRLESERELMKGPNVVRLLKIQRAPKTAESSTQGHTSISRPGRPGKGPRRIQRVQQAAGGLGRTKRSFMSISLMLMNPRQAFHPSSGTFSTDAGIAALRAGRPKGPRPVAASPKSNRREKTAPNPDLPDSIDDLITRTRRRRVFGPDYHGPDPRKFIRDQDAILRWELRNEDLFRRQSEGFRYINQTVQDSFESAPIDGDIQFDNEIERARAELVPEPGSAPPTRTTRKTTRRKARQQNVGPPSQTPSFPSLEPAFKVDLTPQNRQLERLNASVAAEDDIDIASQAARQPLRRVHRNSYYLSEALVQKLMTAIAVVRTLAGGWEGKIIDWTLIPYCFPDHDPSFIQERGKTIASRHRLQLAKMQSDFQARFIEAYSNEEVPPINYDDLESYDWEGLVDWATSELEVSSSEKLPDLPATRGQFDSIFELREEPAASLDELYQSAQNMTINRRRAAVAEMPFAVALSSKPSKPTPRKAELSRLSVAKTWVRANVVAVDETYRPGEARQILETVGNSVLENALQSLITDRVISTNSKGREVPGRNYDITDHFLQTLGRKRVIESSELRRAARFKTHTLDPALRSKGKFDVDYAAEDGDIMVLINLFAEGRVSLRPRDPPRDKYGLTDGGYLTRQMDREKVRFAIEVTPVKGKYISGDPIHQKTSSVPPPCPPKVAISETISVPEKIPLWFDIHGQFVKVLWDMAIAAVVGSIAVRPGITAPAVAGMLKPTMETWEVELLLEWMEEVGVTRQEGGGSGYSGWMVKEWWWMLLG
ncbi:RNA polymerase III transcription initiation factor complex subunit [Aspergillus nanangensis]|uniref:RNA polymerase III transcription initiation factor complex subunit n=1 Tax=Aspergillus nanangensis TaxID=2582783 RepID=A0AAD4GX13_ASPNN|nr:RNA polymerase III transcription initiation factor complex subunit [Aspergillus nanangensis]